MDLKNQIEPTRGLGTAPAAFFFLSQVVWLDKCDPLPVTGLETGIDPWTRYLLVWDQFRPDPQKYVDQPSLFGAELGYFYARYLHPQTELGDAHDLLLW